MVEHGAADDKCIPKMHARHRRERIDVFTAHPYRGRVVVSDGVKKAVFRRKQAGRHTWIESEGEEGEQVCQGESASNGSKGGMRWSDIVVPGDEAVRVLATDWFATRTEES